jgi:UDP-N-acetylmuramoylalanine--D-glutamate ligase
VLVGGAGVSGEAVAEALLGLGAAVTVVDRVDSARLAALAARGARTLVAPPALPDGVDQVVVSPGWRPDHPLLVQAAAAGVEVFSEPELAWRLRTPRDGRPAAPWLAVTGTNGKTTTVTMLASILRAAGLRSVAAGNIGHPLLAAVLEPDRYDVLAVELSSFQLHWSARLAPAGGALLNLADDHLDWHGGFRAYAAAKALLWRGVGTVAIGNADDPRVAALLARTPGRRVSFTLNPPRAGQLGVVHGTLVDRAFADPTDGAELGTGDLVHPAGPHNVANALAAAALARAHGVPPEAVAEGLRRYVPEPHRNAAVATVRGVRWVDDSKATNPHAALASLRAYPRIVWVAGGQLKGVDVDELVAAVAGRLAGAVLLGVDRAQLAAALARHAPGIPVTEVATTDDGAMSEVVAAAARLAEPGDTVLLAPAAASLDMYTSYAARGDAFAAAVAALGAG